jgi:hypothetical protein
MTERMRDHHSGFVNWPRGASESSFERFVLYFEYGNIVFDHSFPNII